MSRVLREAYGVSDGMSVRVKAAMKTLGYRPNAAARGMRGKTYTVGIVHEDIKNTFFPDVIAAIGEIIIPSRRQLFYATSEWSSTPEVLASMSDSQVEGVIVIAPVISETKLVEAARQMPLVVTHRYSASQAYDTIDSDDDIGASAVVRHLAEMGHRHIAHLGPITGRIAKQATAVPVRRARAYRRIMEELGLGRYAEVIDCPYIWESGYRAARELLSRDRAPTAIFAGTDNVAFGVLQFAFEAGIEVPRQLSVVGYDNTQMSALGLISLTTVDQSPKIIGAQAAHFLLSRIDGRQKAQRASIEPHLIVRGTSGPPSH